MHSRFNMFSSVIHLSMFDRPCYEVLELRLSSIGRDARDAAGRIE